MTLVVYVIAIALMAINLFLVVSFLVRAYVRYRDSPLIPCPGTGEPAMVEVDACRVDLVRPHLTSAYEIAGPSMRIAETNVLPCTLNQIQLHVRAGVDLRTTV